MRKIFTKIITIITYYILPLILIVVSFISPIKDTFAQWGSLARILLVFILFSKPLSVILKSKFFSYLVSIRRQLGIATFWFFLFHASGFYYLYNLKFPDIYLDPNYFVFWGAWAGVGILILGLTSNRLATKFLRKNWQRVHMLSYPVLFLVLYHSDQAENEPEQFYILSGIFVVLKIIQGIMVNIRNRKKTT